MSTIAKSAGVVFAALVGVPEIDERPRNRPAGAGENLSADFDQPRLAVRFDEIGAFGRTGFEIRPFALPHGRCVAVMALRRRCKRLRERINDHKPRRGERARGEQSAACRLKLHHGLLACGPAPSCNLIRDGMPAASAMAIRAMKKFVSPGRAGSDPTPAGPGPWGARPTGDMAHGRVVNWRDAFGRFCRSR